MRYQKIGGCNQREQRAATSVSRQDGAVGVRFVWTSVMRGTTIARMATKEEARALRAMVAAVDPELVAAVEDVDQTLIVCWLHKTPWERQSSSRLVA